MPQRGCSCLSPGRCAALILMFSRVQYRYPGYWSIGVSGDSVASLEGIKRAYAELLHSSGIHPRVFVLSGFPDHASAFWYLMAAPPEASFETTISALRRAQAHDPRQMARLTALGDNVVVEEVNGSTNSRTVLSGEDPTIFTINGHRYQILELYFVRLPHSIRADGRNPVIATAHVMSDALPEPGEARKVAETIQRRLGGDETVRIWIRRDSWFFDGPPLWYPFAKPQGPPTHQQYVSAGEIFCNNDKADMQCARVYFPDK